MAVVSPPPASLEHEPAPAPVFRVRRAHFTLEHALYLGLFGLSLLLHLWGLGDRAFHHDESHHGYYSWLLFTGQGYTHDPLLHGPFLYVLNAFIYTLFGDTNTTARLGPAIFGSVLVVLPFLLRREIGRVAALSAAVYLAISPAYLYVGRFIRHDMYAVVFELLAFVGVVRYIGTRQTRWLYTTAAALGLMCTNMETFYLYLAIWVPLLVCLLLWRVWRPGLMVGAALALAVAALVFVLPGEAMRSGGQVVRTNGSYVCPSPSVPNPDPNPMQYTPGPVFGFPPLATSDNNYALCVRHQPDNNVGLYFTKLGQFFGHPSVVLALLLTVGTLGGAGFLIGRRRGPDGLTAWERSQERGDPLVQTVAHVLDGRRWLIALGIFVIIYALLFTAFFTNTVGIVSGAAGSLLYWMGQHEEQRGGQPGYYYLLLLLIYEPLVLFGSAAGAVLALVRLVRARGRAILPGAVNWAIVMPALLVWWSALTLFLYSWAGEKMPWLTIHVALPLLLLAAWAFGQLLTWAFGAFPAVVRTTVGRGRALAIYSGAVAAVVLYGVVLMTYNTQQIEATNATTLLIIVATVALVVVALTVLYSVLRGRREAAGALVVALVALVAAGTMRASYQLNYRWGDTPREMLIYTQTSPDIARIMARLEQASIRRTSGLTMPIWYDGETMWNWYMRRFPAGVEQPGVLPGPPPEEVQAVFLGAENGTQQNLNALQGFRIQQVPLRWWFPEDQTYRLPENWRTAEVTADSPLLMRLLRTPNDGRTLAQTWRFLFYRDMPANLGSANATIAVRPGLADEIGLGTGGTLSGK